MGPGHPHAQITSAIEAAGPGDRIFVMPGTYDDFWLEKALEVRGVGPGLTRIAGFEPGSRTRVSGIAAGQVATLAEMSFETLAVGVTTAHPVLDVSGNAGTVVLQRVSVNAAASLAHIGPGLRVANTERLIVQSCVLRGSLGSEFGVVGESGLVAKDSALFISNSTVLATDFEFGAFIPGAPGAPAMRVEDCTLELLRVEARGGLGGADFFSGSPFNGGPALELVHSTAQIRGGSKNLLKGGPTLSSSFAFGGPGVALTTFSNVQLTSDAQVEGGVSGSGELADPFQMNPGTLLTVLLTRWPTLAALGGPVALGTSVQLEHSGEPGSVVLRAVSPGLAPLFVLPPLGGPLHLNATGAFFLPATVLGADGQQTSSAAIPALAGSHVWSQSIELEPFGVLASNPARIAFGR